MLVYRKNIHSTKIFQVSGHKMYMAIVDIGQAGQVERVLAHSEAGNLWMMCSLMTFQSC